MRRWEIEIRNLADDFGLDKKEVDDAVKKAKRISVGKYETDATRRYEYARRILMPLIMSL